MDFLSKVDLTDRSIFLREFKVKHYKVLLKNLIGDQFDYVTLYKNINVILKDITDLTESEIVELTFLDYFLLIFEIRCNSIGSLIFAETTNNDKNVKLEINVNRFTERLKSIDLQSLLVPHTADQFKVELRIPTINEIVNIDFNNLEDIYTIFIKGIHYNDYYFDMTLLSKKEVVKVFEKLPIKITTFITKQVYNIIEYFNNVNLLSYLPSLDKQIIFNFNIFNLSVLLKILFGDQLLNLYDNIFYLCKIGNFTPGYVENCTPGEYLLFLKKLEEANAPNRTEDENTLYNDPIEDEESLNPYDSELPPIVSRSEFTP